MIIKNLKFRVHIRNFFYFTYMENTTGFTCQTCGKIFETKEEFDNRHKKKKNKDKQSDSKKKD